MDLSSRPTHPRWWLGLLLLLHVMPFAVRPALIGGDEPHYALMAHSLAIDHDLALEDDYEAVAAGAPIAGRKFAGVTLDRHLQTTQSGAVFQHPLGLPLLAAPGLALHEWLIPGGAPDIVLGLTILTITFLGLLAGLDLLGARWGRLGWSCGLAVYFSTPLWFYSRTVFTEPLLWSFGAIALWLLRRGHVHRAVVVACWLPWIKEPGVVLLAGFLATLIVMYGRRGVARAVPWLVLSGVLLLVKNQWLYGTPWGTPQSFQYGDVLTGLAGTLGDVRHGLLWFAPLAVVALGAALASIRQGTRLAWIATGTVGGYMLLVASWIDWTGGSCFGPRLLIPIVPLLAWPLVAFAARHPRGWGHWLVVGGVASGMGVQLAALADPFDAFWSLRVDTLVLQQPVAALAGVAIGILGWKKATANIMPASREARTDL